MLAPLLSALLAAVIPTLVFVYLIWWCDRYEREPWWLLLVTFLWGAVPAIVLSIAAELLLEKPFQPLVTGLAGSLLQAGLISPVVEEVAKGLALFGLYRFFQAELDDVLDGIVYGALIGAGFGMTENFFYFLGAYFQGEGVNLLGLTLVRAVVFGANHAYYTAITGAALGYALSIARRRLLWPIPAAGLLLAIVVHALHNLSSSLGGYHIATLALSAVLDWGGVLLLVVVIVLAWREENRWIRAQLAAEVPEVLAPEHYALAQRYAQRGGFWLARLRGQDAIRARLEHELHQTATRLAFQKQRHLRQGGEDTAREISRLRERLQQLSQRLAATHR